jgi:uncharacterized protein YjbI with pentapeptide repeats
MKRRKSPVWICMLSATVLVFAIGTAAIAQQSALPPRIWDIKIGTPVDDLPLSEFVDPACGTNGGPPGSVLAGFDRFAACPEEPTGLREVWFSYNDEFEYIGRAVRDPIQIGRYAANVIFGQQVILSLLVDRTGLVQGYRIISDPHTDPNMRRDAYTLAFHLKIRFGTDGWACTDLPRGEGETPITDRYIKERCEKVIGGQRLTVERRLYFKPGQALFDRHDNQPMENSFESSARLDVVTVDLTAVRNAAPTAERARPVPDPALPREGREAFLAGRTVNCPGCDLSGVNLRGRDLTRANLAGANLTNARLHRAVLRDANLSGANLTDANLNRVRMTNVNFIKANLAGAMLFDADAGRGDFTDADLTGARLGSARMTLAKFVSANLTEADFEAARLSNANLASAKLNGANLHAAILSNANMREVFAEGAVVAEANLRGAVLNAAVLRYSDLYGSDLGDADLSGADFTGSRLLSASLLNSRQEGTIFTGALMPDNTVKP